MMRYLTGAQIQRKAETLFRDLTPPPAETVSEWTDRHRYTDQGKYYVSMAEYQRAPMDAISDPFVEEVVLMWSVQTGKTELILNTIGRYAHREPCNMMWVLPSIEMANNMSKNRLDLMFDRTPALNGLLRSRRTRDSQNAMRFKRFPGGSIILPGANSPASLSGYPIKLLVGDEVDRWGKLIKGEGDILMLARKRTTSFSDKKIVLVSSPTERSSSRIYPAYLETNQQQYHVPCPHCNGKQVLKFPNLKFEYDEQAIKELQAGGDDEEQFDHRKKAIASHIHAWFTCIHCGSVIEHEYKHDMVAAGEWIARYPRIRERQGYQMWQAYSPFVSWAETAAEFLYAHGFPDRMRVFTNTVLGELFEERGQRLDENPLMQRREVYPSRLSDKIDVITIGIDVQGDRFELEVIGWSADGENWSLDYIVLYGNTGLYDKRISGKDEVYRQLYPIFDRTYIRQDGTIITVDAIAIDAGYNTDNVYDFVQVAAKLYRIFAVMGSGGSLKGPLVKKARAGNRRLTLWMIDTDLAKNRTVGRLTIETGSPGSSHWPLVENTPDHDEKYGKAYFLGLTAEEKQTRGDVSKWVKIRERNEPVDTRVYAYTAMRLLSPAWGNIRRRKIEEPVAENPEPHTDEQRSATEQHRRKGVARVGRFRRR